MVHFRCFIGTITTAVSVVGYFSLSVVLGFFVGFCLFVFPSQMSYIVFDFCTSVKYIDPSFGQRSFSFDVVSKDSQK